MFAGVIFFYIQSITDTHNRLCMKNESRFKVWKGKPMQKSLTNTGFLRPISTDIWWLKKSYILILPIFFSFRHTRHTQISLIFVTCIYSCTLWPTPLRSAGCCVGSFQTRFRNRKIVECPLVDKLCIINNHNISEGLFLWFLFLFFPSVFINVNTNSSIDN